MKVILKQDVENVGHKGDILNVAAGYGRNYLIPRKLALEVTASNLKMIDIEKASLKKKVEVERSSFQDLIKKLNQVTLTFARKAGEKDHIFGSVSASDLKDALDKLGFDIDKKKIVLDEPLKRLGNYAVPIKIYHDDRAEIKVQVVKEEEEAPAGSAVAPMSPNRPAKTVEEGESATEPAAKPEPVEKPETEV
ncbi:MAG: 50S ribosomal protein L9 [Candidatus Aminicenantes bacterium]|nr:50S ribosomal protein L9 [Candidatus Aminicenantes bacterium]